MLWIIFKDHNRNKGTHTAKSNPNDHWNPQEIFEQIEWSIFLFICEIVGAKFNAVYNNCVVASDVEISGEITQKIALN